MSTEKNRPSSSPCAMDDFPDYNGLSAPGLAATDEPMKILSSNTIIYCKNWQACCHFYQDILKLETRFSREDWFHELSISDTCHLSIADQSRCSIDPAMGCGLTLSFFVKDLESWHEYLKASDTIPTDITTNSWRAPFFFVRDPDNNRIEFWTSETKKPG